MPPSSQPIQQLKRFLADHGLSHSYAAHRLGISAGTLSKIFKGDHKCISQDSLLHLHSQIEEWIESTEHLEHELYVQVFTVIQNHAPGTVGIVLRRICKDVAQ